MIKATEDTDFGVQRAALEALGKVKDERAAEAVAAQLGGRERRRAAAALRSMGPVAEKAVAKYIGHPDRGVRREALQIATQIATKEMVPELVKVLADPDDGVRHSVLDILKNLKDQRAIVPIANRLEFDRDRGKAADCLKSMGPVVEETVLMGLKHPNPDVIRECCKILEQVGTQKSLNDLKRLSRHRDFFIRTAATGAGRAIMSRGAR